MISRLGTGNLLSVFTVYVVFRGGRGQWSHGDQYIETLSVNIFKLRAYTSRGASKRHTHSFPKNKGQENRTSENKFLLGNSGSTVVVGALGTQIQTTVAEFIDPLTGG